MNCLYITGKPYDTLEEIVGIRGKGVGSLREFEIVYDSVSLTDEGTIDFEAVEETIYTEYENDWNSTFQRICDTSFFHHC